MKLNHNLFFTLKQYNQSFETAPNKKIFLVSFLDGFQKVLMFVDENLNNLSEEVNI